MARITQISDAAATLEAAALFTPIKGRIGMVPNLYRVAANQSAALTGLLGHGEALGRGACPFGRLPAAEIETAVIDQLRALLRTPEVIVATWKAAGQGENVVTENDVRQALAQIDPLWSELFPAEQARIVQLLVERIDVATDGIDIRFRVDGLANLAQDHRGLTTLRSAA